METINSTIVPELDPEQIVHKLEKELGRRLSKIIRARAMGALAGQPGITSFDSIVMAQTYPAAVAYPLGPPTVSTTMLTVDLALQNPTRVTRTLMDLTLQRFFADRVFASGGGVTGGAVIYDSLEANDLYLVRDIGRVAPGGEFPLVTSARRVPKVATVEKWGGKFFTTDEARDRNNVSEYTRQIRQLANTIVRKINQRAVSELAAAIALSPARTLTGHDWGAVVTTGSSATVQSSWPAADLLACQMQAETEELGIVYDLIIMNPTDYLVFATIYGSELSALLSSLGFSVFVTNRKSQGTAYVLAERQVGEMRIEKPLSTETWRDKDGREQTWTQSSVRPLWFVDNRFAVLEITGINPTP